MDLWDFLGVAEDEPVSLKAPDFETPACTYCGSTKLSTPQGNGRADRYTCGTCGGTMVAAPGDQLMPDLIGQQDNHPASNPDPRSGGVGGAANNGVVNEVVQRTKTGSMNSTVSRIMHNDPGCPVCNLPEGFHSHRVASDQPVLKNPVTGGQHWYHGTSYNPVNTLHDDGYSPTHPGGKIVPPKHQPLSEDHVDASWNTDLGTHFSTLHAVANHGFAQPDLHPHARIAHTTLHMKNPIHFGSESEMNSHAINWAHENGHHYLPKKQSEHSKFINADFSNIQHKDGRDYGYLHDHESGLPPTMRKGISRMDKKGVGDLDAHEGIGDRMKLNMKENWLESHPKRSEISQGYQQHLKDQGHDGIVYGNEHEGPKKHTCAIAFHDTPINIHKWEWTHPKGRDVVERLPHVTDKDITPHEDNHHVFTSGRVPFEVTASWADVRNKARRITAEGGVNISVASMDGLTATVQGDHNLYETSLFYVPGTRKVGYWHCGCKWSGYTWGRSTPFRRFEGRMCSHALALQFEALKQHAFGRGDVREHDHRPAWMRDKQVTVHHQRGTDTAPAVDHRRSAGLLPDSQQLAGGLQFEAADEPLDPRPPAIAIAMCSALADERMATTAARMRALGYDATSADVLVREAFQETFVQRASVHTAGVVDEFKRDILMMDGPEHAQGANHEIGGGQPSSGSDDDKKDEGDGTQHNPLDPNLHKTEDSRAHAPEFGAGVPGENDDLKNCTQCNGQGCGHCGGAGQVDLDNLSRIPDQNADAGPYAKGQGMGGGGIPTMSSLHEIGRHVFGEYASNDWQGDPINRDRPGHSDSKNPGSTGWATSSDPKGWSNIHPSETGFSSTGAAKKAPTGPTVGGVALKAHDTGRMLMLQRSFEDEKDPARGTWEFPGGHYEPGDKTGLHGAIREWEEEVGQPFPEGGHVHHTWTSGPYQGHLVVIPNEHQVDLSAKRTVKNPDDDSEQRAWIHPDHAKKYPDLRPEVKANTPWKKLSDASIEKAAGWRDFLSAEPQGTEEPKGGTPSPWEKHRPVQGAPEGAEACVHCGAPTVAYDAHKGHGYCRQHIDEKQSSDRPIAEEFPERAGREPLATRLMPIALMLDKPQNEGALPFTEGEDDDSTDGMGRSPGEAYRSQMSNSVHSPNTSSTPNSATYASLGSPVDDIVARFQATAGASALMAAPGAATDPGGGDIATAAAQHLAKTSMKQFSPAEQRSLISEGEGGPRARNFGDLKIEGTHYTELIDDEELGL